MGFQQIWRPTFSSPPHFLISPSLSWDWIWRGFEADLGLFYLFLIFDKFEKLICCMCWEGIFWVCEMTICCVCWEWISWVYEREFFGFMNENLLSLWKGDFLDYQSGIQERKMFRSWDWRCQANALLNFILFNCYWSEFWFVWL